MDKLLSNQGYAPFCYSAAKLGEADAEFRLLDLLPSATGSPLSCCIFTAKIEQSSQRFKALSYAWGQGPKSHSILVLPPNRDDGPKAVPITESLHTALLNLRHAREPIRLWIDQININQEDLAEKADQVRLMGSIYARAEQVIVWLGPSADDSDALMDAWETIGQAARDWGLESYHTRERWPLLHPIIHNLEPSDPRTTAFQALLATATVTLAPLIRAGALSHWFARPWFTRAWIVQEFCLCPSTVFVAGRKSIPVELVKLAVQILQNALNKPHLLHSVNAPYSLLNDIVDEPTARLFSCRQRRLKFDRGEPDSAGDQLHALLRKLYVEHDTRSTLPRDRVFSLLGLAVDAGDLGLVPGYEGQGVPAAEARVLTEAARAMITNAASGRVDVLCFAQFPKATTDVAAFLPSWVPEWRAGLRPSFYQVNEGVSVHLLGACGAEMDVRPVVYSGCRCVDGEEDESGTCACPPPESVLGLGGYVIDTIESVAQGGAWDDMEWDAGGFLGAFRQVDGLFELAMAKEKLPALYESQERRSEARWRVPVGGLYLTTEKNRHRVPAEAAVHHKQAMDFLGFLVSCADLGNEDQSKRFQEWGYHEKIARDEVGGDYRESMKYLVGKRPFLTKEGYLGMGPADAVAGDVVVVFPSGRIPFVLRPLEAEWRNKSLFTFVGEAYCDGVMDGEAVEGAKLTELFLA